ncbi:hypothetical protein Tco_0435210 [Tanacetum coccineum]
MQPVAPPSPDYIPCPEDPQTPPVPQDEDEREPMFTQAHDPDYVPEPVYPEYIPLEDEHGDDGDDNDGDSSGDDADDEDVDEDEEDEEEHVAPVDFAVVIPTVKPVSPPEGTEPVIPPPSTNISTTRARITVRLQASISLPPEAKVERLLAMTTPSPSPPISLSPPSAGERLARIASTQALIDAITAALPSPPLPPSLYIPPPIDRRDYVPKSELLPRKRLCLSTLDSRYEIGESSTARPTRDLAEAIPEVAPMTVREVNTRVTELTELYEHDTQDLMTLQETVWIMEEEAYASREAWAHSIGLSQATHQELQTHLDHVYVYETHIQAHQAQLQLQSTLIQTHHQAELLAHRKQQRRARQPGPDARILDHQDASGDADSHI